ncbi:ABCE1 [Mytilus coruscus]|uniref:ABCE1 n=1 Tax=Mytilus coruscus TaxID=42192 RepID=A0A6J8C9T5_MYTCO|nr:ABCE1 [Mytilus coruscus]
MINNNDKCKPKRFRQECKKSCPVVRMGKLCIEVSPTEKIAFISEELCIGCCTCICAKLRFYSQSVKCPFEVITIINLPSNIEKDTTHRYSANSLKLHRANTWRLIPITCSMIELVDHHLFDWLDPPDWTEILTYFRGSELQNFFTKILEDDLKAIIKPQYVDQIPKAVKGLVQALLDKKDDLKTQIEVCMQTNGFMFDETSSYLDVKQRLKAALAIRELIHADKYIIVVEHDLSILDYLSDFICVLYGIPGAYGIKIFLDGFVLTENLRCRENSLTFKVAETAMEEEIKRMCRYEYPNQKKFLDIIVYEVFTQRDKYSSDDPKVVEKERQFLTKLGISETRFARIKNYCPDVVPSLKYRDMTTPSLDIPVLRFLEVVRTFV